MVGGAWLLTMWDLSLRWFDSSPWCLWASSLTGKALDLQSGRCGFEAHLCPVPCGETVSRAAVNRLFLVRIQTRESTRFLRMITMILISPRCAILNLLAAKEQISPGDLKAFAEVLKKKINESYVDISSDAVLSFVEDYGEVLSMDENDNISRTDAFGSFAHQSFLDLTVNAFLSDKHKSLLKESVIEVVGS